jgi:hypothetical protein
MRPARKFRGGIGHLPNPQGHHDGHGAAQDYFEECGIHAHPHSQCDAHHHIPPEYEQQPVEGPHDDGYDSNARGIGVCSTGSCGVGATPDGQIVQKPRGMTRAGYRKFMKRLGKGRAATSLTAKRVARGMGVVGTWQGE